MATPLLFNGVVLLEPVFGNMSHEERASTPVGRVSSSPAAGRSPVTVRRKLKARTLVELFYEAEAVTCVYEEVRFFVVDGWCFAGH